MKIPFSEEQRELALTVASGATLAAGWVCDLLGAGPTYLSTALIVMAIAFAGVPIIWEAVVEAVHLRLNVEALVAIAAIAAVVMGDYFEAAMVLFILMLGETLEAITVAKTSKAIHALSKLLPDEVTVKRGGTEQQIPSSEVVEGDILLVRPGHRIAVDGVVVSGYAGVDQSLISGESMPVEKGRGDTVYSGSIAQAGALEIRATQVGQQTTVAKIKRMITDAQGRKATVERLVDRWSTYFVPTMLVIAALVFLVTGDARRAITVLIVACPCAFVLGTPTAVVAAIGAAARQGIVIRGGDILETLGRVNAIIFDKTGTLTSGQPQVTHIQAFGSFSREEVLRLAAIAEQMSEHPLAGAIRAEATERGIAGETPAEFRVHRGRGVSAVYNQQQILLGNRQLMQDNQVPVPKEVVDDMAMRAGCGDTALAVAVDRQVCGIIALSDPVRSETADSIKELRQTGRYQLLGLCTGDNSRTAQHVSGQLQLDTVAADMVPEDKAETIRRLSDQNHVVAMVGDGINDAPALAMAPVGIAMGMAGSEVATEAADVTLLTDNLHHVGAVLDLGRRALRVIRQNLVFAIVFNSAMILLAATGVVSMIVGAVCHQLSSLAVIANSMRLLNVLSQAEMQEAAAAAQVAETAGEAG